jgi:hypothetical protein
MRWALVVAAWLAATRVAAASPASDRAFREGKDLLKAGKLAEACEAFAESAKLEPRVGTLLNLADCRERQGQTATAWSLFREAKALAAQSKDKREREATARAAALEPKLAYLTLKIEHRVDGLAIKRNGVAVDASLWDQPVPLDPGSYALEAAAPKYQPWSATQPLGPREHVDVAVALVPTPVPAPPPPDVKADPQGDAKPDPDGAVKSHGRRANSLERDVAVDGPHRHQWPDPPLRPLGIGVAFSWRSDTDNLLVGGHVLGSLAVPGGALRGSAQATFTKTQITGINDPTDPTNTTKIYAFGIGLDYVWMPVPQFAFAAGVSVGYDYYVETLDSSASDWRRRAGLRASPLIVRLAGGHLELGLHGQLDVNRDGVYVTGLAAIDVFPL